MPASRRLVWTFAAFALAACGDDSRETTSSPPTPPAATPRVRAEPPPPRDPRLREDCGGWEPDDGLLDFAARLGDPATKAAALIALNAATPAHRLDILRAGLRLADDAAARVCAARLTYTQIDRWECARCVALLGTDVLRPGTEGDFEELRSYIGSVEMTSFLRALPPTPWKDGPARTLAELHRTSLVEHLPAYLALTRNADADVASGAWENVGLLCTWNDDLRAEVETAELVRIGVAPPPPSPDDATGLPPVLAAYLRATYLKADGSARQEEKGDIADFDRRWMWECTPAPKDADLLTALAEHYDVNELSVAGAAVVLLGKLSDPATETVLRRLADDGDGVAKWALARRGDAAMLDDVAAHANDDEGFPLAVLMEADPQRARRLLDETLLGADDAAAHALLESLANFATPGAWWEPCGFDWRRTSLAGFADAAIAAKVPSTRLARIGVVVPGCRTRALADAAAGRLRPGAFVPNDDLGLSWSTLDELGGFLETGAPETLRASLREIRDAGGEDRETAVRWLVALGDGETAAALVTLPWTERPELHILARTRAPEVRNAIVQIVRTARPDALGDALVALAIADGLPEDAAVAFGISPPPGQAVIAALAGRPVDALAALLARNPDDPHGNVGAVDDPRVRAYLARLRERRDLGHYWYATAQLAVLGDAAARADYWGAMKDGRYRILNESNFFERTLGWDLAATMPYWIDEARSQCCVLVTSGGGDILQDLLGLPSGTFQSPYRTPYRRAKEMWDAAGGRFVKSRILSNDSCPRFVPAPR